MFSKKSVDQAEKLTDQVIKSTEHASNEALESLVDSLDEVRQRAEPLLHRASEQVSAMAQRGLHSVRDTSQQWRDQAQRVSENTVSYVRVEPVKSMLMAAATGAALMALFTLLSRSRGRG
jgi:ElaB/YqjD/DUF883 family membrane-anchored ribosome-binding protein